MGACWSDSKINYKPDRFNVNKHNNEIILDTENVHAHNTDFHKVHRMSVDSAQPDHFDGIKEYYHDMHKRRKAGIEFIEPEERNGITMYTF